MGSERFEVSTFVPEYQSFYELEGICVQNISCTKGYSNAPTIVTCSQYLFYLPPTAINVILVDLPYLDDVAVKLEQMF